MVEPNTQHGGAPLYFLRCGRGKHGHYLDLPGRQAGESHG